MDKPDRITELRAFVTAAFAAVTALIGWVGWLVVIMLVCMVLDYLTGTFAACKDKEWRTVRKIPDTCRSKNPYSGKSAGTDGDN